MRNIYSNRFFAELAWWVMVSTDVLVFLSTLLGGYILIVLNGGGMDVSKLSGSIFTSYFWPGVILVSIVGGSHLLAALLLIQKSTWWFESSAIAGCGLLIWIITEIFIIRDLHVLQLVYFCLGLLNITLTLFVIRAKTVKTKGR